MITKAWMVVFSYTSNREIQYHHLNNKQTFIIGDPTNEANKQHDEKNEMVSTFDAGRKGRTSPQKDFDCWCWDITGNREILILFL